MTCRFKPPRGWGRNRNPRHSPPYGTAQGAQGSLSAVMDMPRCLVRARTGKTAFARADEGAGLVLQHTAAPHEVAKRTVPMLLRQRTVENPDRPFQELPSACDVGLHDNGFNPKSCTAVPFIRHG